MARLSATPADYISRIGTFLVPLTSRGRLRSLSQPTTPRWIPRSINGVYRPWLATVQHNKVDPHTCLQGRYPQAPVRVGAIAMAPEVLTAAMAVQLTTIVFRKPRKLLSCRRLRMYRNQKFEMTIFTAPILHRMTIVQDHLYLTFMKVSTQILPVLSSLARIAEPLLLPCGGETRVVARSAMLVVSIVYLTTSLHF